MKKLAILGASYLQLPLVEKANAMGIETHCFAWDNEEAVCKNVAHFFYPVSVLDSEIILQMCREIGIDGITTIATDICVPTICFVASELGLVGNTYDSAIVATNKALMRKRFEQHGVTSPKFIGVAGYEPSQLQQLEFPLIVKPTDRSGSRGVTKVYTPSELRQAITDAVAESLENKAVVEEFITGSEISVECISYEGVHYLLAVTDKVTTGEPHFVELQHHQPSQLPQEILESVRMETFKALDALGVRYGASHSEFKITDTGKVTAVEVGARMGGDFIGSHLVQLSTGYDFVEGVVHVALGQFEKPDVKEGQFSGVYFLSKESENLLPYFKTANTFDTEKKILREELRTIKSSNDRSGYLIYQSATKIIL